MGKELVFIPAYNCERQIHRTLQQFTPEVCDKIDTILVINNRSTDRTEELACVAAQKIQGAQIKVLRNSENYGLGGSQKIGFQYACDHGFDHVTILHGDDQGSIAELLDFLEEEPALSADALLGARFMTGASTPGYSAFRIFGNHVFNMLFSICCGTRLYDLGAGLNRYAVSALKDMYFMKFPDALTFNYAMILAHCYRKDFIRFFPITWREEDQVSNVKVMRQALSVLLMLGKYCLHKGKYIASEMRLNPKPEYTYDIIYENTEHEEFFL